jgi:hypothetical protein
LTVDDVVWALVQLRAAGTRIAGSDICGAFSPPEYARWTQHFAAEIDHPKLPTFGLEAARQINLRAFNALWPVLGGSSVPPLNA